MDRWVLYSKVSIPWNGLLDCLFRSLASAIFMKQYYLLHNCLWIIFNAASQLGEHSDIWQTATIYQNKWPFLLKEKCHQEILDQLHVLGCDNHGNGSICVIRLCHSHWSVDIASYNIAQWGKITLILTKCTEFDQLTAERMFMQSVKYSLSWQNRNFSSWE